MNINNHNDSTITSSTPDIILKDIFNNKKNKCLFLDIDGTLCNFRIDPNQCFIPPEVLFTLKAILSTSTPIMAVTGRNIISAKNLFESIELPIASLHGLEIYISKDNKLENYTDNENEISKIYSDLQSLCLKYPKIYIENKDQSIALHYRACPELEPIVRNIIIQIYEKYPAFKLLSGKYVFELVPSHANKGTAIKKLLNHFDPTHSLSPIFIGDDLTDEDGFFYINQFTDGTTIKVGEGQTQAKYRLKNINKVYEFLKNFSKLLTSNHSNTPLSYKTIGENTCLN